MFEKLNISKLPPANPGLLNVLLLVGLVMATSGCLRPSGTEVIVYSALDREYAKPIFDAFYDQTGIRVRAKYDPESTKTVGLTAQLIAESAHRTRCDVFWNNEIVNTIRLDRLNLLESYQPRHLASYPPATRSPADRWFGFAARARVLLVNTEVVAADDMPGSLYDLLDTKWKGKVGIAKPLFGSTATHAVCLFDALGPAKARKFFEDLKANDVQVLSGNKQVAEDVASGKIAFGLTDTDDALVELEGGHPVEIVYPDAADGQMGTLFFPNTLCLLKGGPNPSNARRLIDFLLSDEVERALANGPSSQIPLHQDVQMDLRVETPATVAAMPIDFDRAARNWDAVAAYLDEEFMAVK